MCTNRQLFLWCLNHCPSVCAAKVISWHAFVSDMGMLSKKKWHIFNDYWRQWIIRYQLTWYELVWCQGSCSLWTRKIISWFSFLLWLTSRVLGINSFQSNCKGKQNKWYFKYPPSTSYVSHVLLHNPISTGGVFHLQPSKCLRTLKRSKPLPWNFVTFLK